VRHIQGYMALLYLSLSAAVCTALAGLPLMQYLDGKQDGMAYVARWVFFTPATLVHLGGVKPSSDGSWEFGLALLHWTAVFFCCGLVVWRWLARRKR
jgi:hypothetical protein